MSRDEKWFTERLGEIEEALGYTFADRSLLEQALTHSSYANETGPADFDNERLEFLGDAILELVVSARLFSMFDGMSEGELTRARAHVVKAASLADVARKLCLGDVIRMGKGETATGGRQKKSLLSDALEALFGAIYLDAGFHETEGVILRSLQECFVAPEVMAERDPKGKLQELIQDRGQPAPTYALLDESGLPHCKVFVVEVRIEDRPVAVGRGSSKKEAAVRAAALALDTLLSGKND